MAPARLVAPLLIALAAPTAHAQPEASPPPQPAEPALRFSLALSGGMQFDGRSCAPGGGQDPFPGPCLLFAGGVEGGLLWRWRVGAVLGLYSVNGVGAAVASDGATQVPAIPDRISIPLSVELRPAGFFVPPGGYRRRLLHGLGLRVGPSLELLRTASDQVAGLGFHLGLFGELPLYVAPHHSVSLRVLGDLLISPRASLNNGVVRSVNFSDCADPCPSGTYGYGPVGQLYLGLVYLP